MKAENDYERGQDAFIDGDAHLYNSGSEEFKQGYKDRFNAHIPESYHEGSGFYAEVAWDQHVQDEIEAFDQSAAFASIHEEQAKRLAYKQLTMQVAAFLCGFLAAAIMATVILAPFLLTADEVAGFWGIRGIK